MAAGGVPPTVRLMAAGRAVAPPAMAVSIQVPPALVNCSAKTFTAADSPPEVHQWITSAFISCAYAGTTAVQTRVSAVKQSLSFMSVLPDAGFYPVCNRLHFAQRGHPRRPSQPFIESMARNTVTGEVGISGDGQANTQTENRR